MSVHLQTEIEKLKKMVIALGTDVEENLHLAVQSLQNRDTVLGEKIIRADRTIDLREVNLEEECLKILALHQPVANDLRFVIAVLKINNDLERIGNQAVVIAEQVLALAHMPDSGPDQLDMGNMLERVEVMVRQSVEALLTRNVDLAWQIWEEHVGAEEDLRRVIDGLVAAAEKRPGGVSRAMHLARAAVALSRVSENTKDIAEEVIYMREGIIVKHHEREFRNRKKPRVAEPAEQN